MVLCEDLSSFSNAMDFGIMPMNVFRSTKRKRDCEIYQFFSVVENRRLTAGGTAHWARSTISHKKRGARA